MSLIIPEKKQRNPPKGEFVKDRRAVIDGDRYPYMIGFACQSTIWEVWVKGEAGVMQASFESAKEMDEWLKGFGHTKDDFNIKERIEADPLQNCLHSVKLSLESAIEGSKAETYQVYVGGKNNFRDEVAVTALYKGTRDQAKPIHFDAIREYMINYWDAIEVDGIEADDQLAIEFTKDPENTVIVSDDKDLNTVPAWRYIPSKDVLFKNSEQDALLWFYCQMIIGDTVDNIKGIPGKGKMAAYKILQDRETEVDMFNAVFAEYHKQYPDNCYTMFMEQAWLLYMVREMNDDGSPKMYEVPK